MRLRLRDHRLRVSEELGGEAALAQFRERLARRGTRLMLDFVPNHTAPDHPWVKTQPDYYMQGSEELLRVRRRTTCGSRPIGGRESWHMAATPIILVGPIRYSSTTPIRSCRSRESKS